MGSKLQCKKILYVISLITCFSCVLSFTAAAEESYYLKPSVGYLISDGSRDARNDRAYGLGLGWLSGEEWNVELELLGHKLDFKNSSSEIEQYSATLNGLYFYNGRDDIAPYITLGAGWLFTENWPNNTDNLTTHFGFGAWFQANQKQRLKYFGEIKVRQDYDRDTFSGEDLFFDVVLQAGLILPFGNLRNHAHAANHSPFAYPRSLYWKPIASIGVPDSSRDASSDIQPGLAIGWLLNDKSAIELGFEGHKFKLDGGGDVEQYGLNLNGVYHFNGQERFSPYLTYGAGWMTTNVGRTNHDNFTTNFGAGIGYEVGERFGARLIGEVKLRQDYNNDSFSGESMFFDAFFNLGLVMPFGQQNEPLTAIEVVPESNDYQPNRATYSPGLTKLGSAKNGADLSQPAAPLPDRQVEVKAMPRVVASPSSSVQIVQQPAQPSVVPSQAPSSAKSHAVCSSLDMDCDGVPNGVDRCDNTPPRAEVDVDGCFLSW